MDKIIKNSLIFKAGLKVVEIYKKGAIYNFFEWIKLQYTNSKTMILWENFIKKESAVYSSVYAKIAGKISDFILKLGVYFENSFVYKIFTFFVNLGTKIISGSIVCKPFYSLGFKGCLIVLFAMYLPVDYVLRSVLNMAGLASIWDELLLVLFIGTILYRHAMRKTTSVSKLTPLDSYLFMFFCIGLFLMCFVAPYFHIAVAGYRAVFQYILWFFAIVRLVEDDRDFKILYNSLVALIIGLGIHCVYQFIIAVPIPETWTTSTEDSVRTRVFSLTGSPNVMGSILVLLTPMVTAFAYNTKQIWAKIIAFGITGMLCLSLLFTFSKGAWVGMAVAIVIFAVFVDRKILALLLAGGAAVVVAVPSVVSRVTFLFTDDYKYASEIGGRTLRWATGLDLLAESSEFFGFGLGRFGGAVAMQNQLLEITEDFEYFYMDNYYLKTLVEMGYLGLIFYIIALVALVVLSIKAIGRVRGTELYAPCVAMFSGMCGVLVHCYFENIFEVPYMTSYFWAMAGMLMYAGFIRKKCKKLDN